jgi:hypothetical protein
MTDHFAGIIANAVPIGGPTDLTITCRDGRRFEVHKAVVCHQSHVFAVMCSIGMTEQHTGVIEHKVFDSDTVELMLQFAYSGAYVVTKRPVPLSSLDRKYEGGTMEEGLEEAIQDETEKDEVEGDIASGTGDDDGSGKGVGSKGVGAADTTAADATAADATAADATVAADAGARDDGAVVETIRDRQEPKSLSPHVSNATIPWSDSPWLRFTDQLVTDARVYGLADYYEMEGLRSYALESFSSLVHQRRLDLREGDTMESFIDVAREVGTRTATGTDLREDPLRNSFLKLVMEHATDLCTNRQFIKDLGNSGFTDLAADMLYEVAQQMRRDCHYSIDKRISMTTILSHMKEHEEFWEDCAPGWR